MQILASLLKIGRGSSYESTRLVRCDDGHYETVPEGVAAKQGTGGTTESKLVVVVVA